MAALTFPNFPKCPETGTPGISRTSRAPYKGREENGSGETGLLNGYLAFNTRPDNPTHCRTR